MSPFRMTARLVAPVVLLAGCGGGGGEIVSQPFEGTSYSFSRPAVGSSKIYDYTIADDHGGQVALQIAEVVSGLDPDGTFALNEGAVSGSATGSLATTSNYFWQNRTVTLDNSGRQRAFGYASGLKLIRCTEEPYHGGPSYPLSVGKTWSVSYVTSCDLAATTAYTEAGKVTAIEPVTVPAGTFEALKLESVVTWKLPPGYADTATRTETVTTWRDTRTSALLKQVVRIGYSGTSVVAGCPTEAQGWLSMGVGYAYRPTESGCPVSTSAELAAVSP